MPIDKNGPCNERLYLLIRALGALGVANAILRDIVLSPDDKDLEQTLDEAQRATSKLVSELYHRVPPLREGNS